MRLPCRNTSARTIGEARIAAVPAVEGIAAAHGHGQFELPAVGDILLPYGRARCGAVIVKHDAQTEIDKGVTPLVPILRPLCGQLFAVAHDNFGETFAAVKGLRADKIYRARHGHLRESRIGKGPFSHILQAVFKGKLCERGTTLKCAGANIFQAAAFGIICFRAHVRRRDRHARKIYAARKGTLLYAHDAFWQHELFYFCMLRKPVFVYRDDGQAVVFFGDNELFVGTVKSARRNGISLVISTIYQARLTIIICDEATCRTAQHYCGGYGNCRYFYGAPAPFGIFYAFALPVAYIYVMIEFSLVVRGAYKRVFKLA